MSTKSTIFLTNENEHCYEEGAEYALNEKTGKIQNVIVLEIEKKNAELISEPTDDYYMLYIKPGSEIYDLLLKARRHLNSKL